MLEIETDIWKGKSHLETIDDDWSPVIVLFAPDDAILCLRSGKVSITKSRNSSKAPTSFCSSWSDLVWSVWWWKLWWTRLLRWLYGPWAGVLGITSIPGSNVHNSVCKNIKIKQKLFPVVDVCCLHSSIDFFISGEEPRSQSKRVPTHDFLFYFPSDSINDSNFCVARNNKTVVCFFSRLCFICSISLDVMCRHVSRIFCSYLMAVSDKRCVRFFRRCPQHGSISIFISSHDEPLYDHLRVIITIQIFIFKLEEISPGLSLDSKTSRNARDAICHKVAIVVFFLFRAHKQTKPFLIWFTVLHKAP